MFNPEQVVKISLFGVEDRIEQLYIRKRYTEALELIANSYSKPMQSKVQHGYLCDLIKKDQFGKVQEHIQKYLGLEREGWVHIL